MSINYAGLKTALRAHAGASERCAGRLLEIRKSLKELRHKQRAGSLLLATWNLRDFGGSRLNPRDRLPESLYYIAEIISHFDLVALQEINRDLAPFEQLVHILGHEWDWIATDTTEDKGGNDERMAFVWNTKKVWFRKIAGEIVLPRDDVIIRGTPQGGDDAGSAQGYQFARTPFLVAFQSGWFKFSLCTVHIYYGQTSGEKLQQRIDEIGRVVQFFANRQDSSKAERDNLGNVENYILLGDFNVVSPDHKTMDALRSHGFQIPAAIDGTELREGSLNYYDQIALRVKDERFGLVGGGVVDLYADVFRDNAEDLEVYRPFMEEDERRRGRTLETDPEHLRKHYRRWRTWQLSDHSPLWVEVRTDYSDFYLQGIAAPVGEG